MGSSSSSPLPCTTLSSSFQPLHSNRRHSTGNSAQLSDSRASACIKTHFWLDEVVHTCNPSTQEAEAGGSRVQVVEHLSSKCEALSSNPSTRKKKVQSRPGLHRETLSQETSPLFFLFISSRGGSKGLMCARQALPLSHNPSPKNLSNISFKRLQPFLSGLKNLNPPHLRLLHSWDYRLEAPSSAPDDRT
jgi:hypothetical protein